MLHHLSYYQTLGWLALLSLLSFPLTGQDKKIELGVPVGHRTQITAMKVLPDGTLVTSGGGNILYQWSLEEKRLLKRHFVHKSFNINDVTGDGILIDRTKLDSSLYQLRLFDPATGRGRITTVPFSDYVSRDGKYCAEDGKLKPLFPEDGLAEIDLKFPSLHFNVTGSRLLWDNPETGKQEIWSYPELKQVKDNNDYEDMAGCDPIYIINNGDYLAGILPRNDEQLDILFFKSFTGLTAGRITVPDNYEARSYNAPTNSALVYVYSTSTGYDFWRYDLATQRLANKIPPPPQTSDNGESYFTSVLPVFSKDGKTIIQTDNYGGIYLYDAKTGILSDSLVPQVRSIGGITLASDGSGFMAGAYGKEEFSAVRWDWYDDNTLSTLEVGNEKELTRFFEDFDKPKVDEHFLALTEPGSRTADALRSLRGLSETNELGTLNGEYRYEISDKETLNPNESFFEVFRTMPDGKEVRREFHIVLDNPLADGSLSDYEIFEDQYIAVGTNGGYLVIFDVSGELLYSKQLHDGPIRDISITADGSKLMTAGEDGGIYILAAASREPIAALYLMGDNEWVVIGQNNRFDASPLAMSKLYYKMYEENGDIEIIELDQMKDRFYDPGLLQKVLGLSAVPKRNTAQLDQVKLYPEATLEVADDRLNVSLQPRSGGIGRVAFFVNDKELAEDIDPSRATSFSIDLTTYRQYFLYDNVLSLQLYNQEESLRSAPEEVAYVYADGARTRGTATTSRASGLNREDYLGAKLYVVAIGTSVYAPGTGKSLDLSYPDRDAEAMSIAMKSTGCELFCTNGEVEVTCLTTDKAAPANLAADQINWLPSTKENVERTLENLRTKTRPQDIVVVYFSGHGKTYRSNGKDQFHYLTREVSPDNANNASAIKNAVISSEEMTVMMKKIPAGKQVLILDACNSGQIITDVAGAGKALNSSQILALTRMSDRTGLYLLTGSAADMVSFEANKYGQGLLTYALLKGMSGAALTQDQNNTFLVGVTELFEYAQREVVDLAVNINGIQKPQVNYPRRAGSFPLGIVNERVKQLVGREKIIICRPNFQKDTTFSDDLDLENKLIVYLQEEATEGTNAAYIYIRQYDFPNAYSVRGRYNKDPVSGLITLRANLVRKGATPIPLTDRRGQPLSAKTVDRLAEKVERALRDALPSGG